jgi:hypothetical protein
LSPESDWSSVKCLRYHAIPEATQAPLPVVAAVAEKGLAGGFVPSMAQSCGTLSERHELSANVAVSAPVASPLLYSQL